MKLHFLGIRKVRNREHNSLIVYSATSNSISEFHFTGTQYGKDLGFWYNPDITPKNQALAMKELPLIEIIRKRVKEGSFIVLEGNLKLVHGVAIVKDLILNMFKKDIPKKLKPRGKKK